jgi:hypothetical protein
MSSSAIAPAQDRCGARTRDGGSCTQWPVKGTTRCKMHGGLAPRVQAKVRAMELTARINGELQALGWEPVTDPIPRYAELAGETLAFKDLARERINELESWEHEGSNEQVDVLDIHAAVKVYQWALEQSERILGRMSSLGLTAEILREALHLEAERPTREQVATLTTVLDKVLADPRVFVDPAVARRVVVEAMVAAGIADHTPSER